MVNRSAPARHHAWTRLPLGAERGFALDQAADAARREVDQPVHLLARERVAFGRAPHLDEAAAPVITTFRSVSQAESGIVEVGTALPSYRPTDTAATKSHGRFSAPAAETADRVVPSDERAVIAAARSAVGLQRRSPA